jgi:amidohydrolase
MEQLPQRLEAITEDVIRWRRTLHEQPELSFEEVRTSRWIYDMLHSFGGLELSRPTKTSVLARLKGAHPGPVVAFRADIDALPIQEETNLSYRSRRDGVMHACGHDAHAAMLLGAARVLSDMADSLRGEIRFLFQHAEELQPGGAIEIVETGVLDDVDAIFGLHVDPNFPTGVFATKAGILTSATDRLDVTITGRGGHASMPHKCIDPVVIGAEFVLSAQQIVSRRLDPALASVVSITQFDTGGGAINVIPDRIRLGGSVRTFDPEARQRIPDMLEALLKGLTEASGASYTFTYERGYPSTVNDAGLVDVAERLIRERMGDARFVRLERPLPPGEDFARYTEKLKGCFIALGAGNEATVYPHHHPRFVIDEAALAYGVKFWVHAALLSSELVGSR